MKLGRKLWMALCLALAVCLCAQVALPVTTGVVTKAQAAAKVKLNKTKATIYTGQKLQLKLTGTNDKVTWSSSDKSIAKVDKKGKVTAKKPGKVTITAKAGKKKYKCKVTVKAAIKVKNDKIEINQGDTVEVDVTYYLDGTIEFKSNNEQVATCAWDDDWRGDHMSLYITGEKAGTATVTLTNDKSKDKVKIQVTVKGAASPETDDHRSYRLEDYLDRTLDELNNDIPDKLIPDGDEYSNAYFRVKLNSDNRIKSIIISHDIPLSQGGAKYQLFNSSPGMGFLESQRFLSMVLWKPVLTDKISCVYKNNSFPSCTLTIMYFKDIIDYVSYSKS